MVAQEVFWFEISMEVVVLVHVGETLQRLKHNVSDLVLREETLPILHQLVHVLVKVLEHEVQNILLQDHFVQLDYVWMMEFHERQNLPEADALIPLVVLLLHLFYGHDLT